MALINAPTQNEVNGLTKYLEASNSPNLLSWLQKKDAVTTPKTEVIANLNIFERCSTLIFSIRV